MLAGFASGDCIFTSIVLMLVNPRRVEGKVVLTNCPSRRIDAFAGETVKFNWNYTVGDKNMDFGYYASSPVWYYHNADGTRAAIAVDDGLHDWKWTISRSTCPPRLLYPTVRVRKESVATLVISNVTKSDSGWYEIYLALRIAPAITDRVELVVTDKMVRFTKVPPSKLFVAKGKAARFEWEYTYDNRNIEFHPESHVWAYINQNNQWVTIATEKRDQSSSAVINTTTCPARLLNPLRVSIKQPATLVISNVTEADNGKYGCRLRLQREFPINSTSILIVTDYPKLFLWTLKTSKIVQEGSDVTINCSANGSPAPIVTWTKVVRKKMLMISRNSRNIGWSLMKIKEMKRNEGGTYECQANNNPNEPPVTARINIAVMYFKNSSILLDKNDEAKIVEGKDLYITCAISPIWLANITWVRVLLDETYKLGNDKVNSGTLAIRNISRSQQGEYQCQAYDKRDGILGMAHVYITVMYKPEIDQMLSTQHNISWFGDTIYLRCVARGVPVPNVTWYGLDGRIIVNGTSYYPGNSTLKLLKLNSLDFGMYICRAKNRYGIAWHNVTVTRYCPCRQRQQKKKNENKNVKKNNKPTNSFADSTASIVLLSLSVVSILINVFLSLILVSKTLKSKTFPQTKGSKEVPYNSDSTGATGQLVLANINSEPPTIVQPESTTNTNVAVQGHYEALTSNSVKMSSPRNYEHLNPTTHHHNHQKGFQTFGNHHQSSYEQLQQVPSFSVYQKPHKPNDIESSL